MESFVLGVVFFFLPFVLHACCFAVCVVSRASVDVVLTLVSAFAGVLFAVALLVGGLAYPLVAALACALTAAFMVARVRGALREATRGDLEHDPDELGRVRALALLSLSLVHVSGVTSLGVQIAGALLGA